MITYPKAKVTVSVNRRKPSGSTARATLHTTETASSAFYTKSPYYTFQVREHEGIVYWRQFSYPEQISHALRHSKGDPQTNGEGTINFSVSIVGYARVDHIVFPLRSGQIHGIVSQPSGDDLVQIWNVTVPAHR